jgi:putative membrane protein
VLATTLVTVVALIHIYILVLEMFLWNTKTGRKAFNLSADFARETRVLAANQGLYNGFLAAGLLWGLWRENGIQVTVFFLAACLSPECLAQHGQSEDTVCSGYSGPGGIDSAAEPLMVHHERPQNFGSG